MTLRVIKFLEHYDVLFHKILLQFQAAWASQCNSFMSIDQIVCIILIFLLLCYILSSITIIGPNPENLFSLRFTTAGEPLLNNDLLYPSSSTTQDQEMQWKVLGCWRKVRSQIKKVSISLYSIFTYVSMPDLCIRLWRWEILLLLFEFLTVRM